MGKKTAKFDVDEWFWNDAAEWGVKNGISNGVGPAIRALAYRQLETEKKNSAYQNELIKQHIRIKRLEKLLTNDQIRSCDINS